MKLQDGWALGLIILLGAFIYMGGCTTKKEVVADPHPIIFDNQIEREPEIRTVYLPAPTQPTPINFPQPQPAPPINIAVIIDGKELKTPPVVVKQEGTKQTVETPETNVTQSHPCDPQLEEHNQIVSGWERQYRAMSKKAPRQ